MTKTTILPLLPIGRLLRLLEYYRASSTVKMRKAARLYSGYRKNVMTLLQGRKCKHLCLIIIIANELLLI